MVKRGSLYPSVFCAMFLFAAAASAQQMGSIRGVVYDQDFEAPLAFAQVSIAETGQRITGTEQGNYVFEQVPPGNYTLVFSKEGYTRQVKADVVVSAGQLTDVDVWLSGEFAEMEEFIVQEVVIGGGTEAGLLQLRFESPALLDSISAELMSQAGASDAAAALNLIAGTTVQEGKFAVVRGLPDRYVNSQMNGVRLPTADPDKRAVELDQFPAAVIESVQVSKTFTPDQQGDASGGAVNVVLKGIPDENIIQVSSQIGFNSQVVAAGDDFLTYEGGGVNYWGFDNGSRDIHDEFLNADEVAAILGGTPITDFTDGMFGDAAGVSRGWAPIDYKWGVTAGGKIETDEGITLGGAANFFYERDSAFYDNGIDDKLYIPGPLDPIGLAFPDDPMLPQFTHGANPNEEGGEGRTKLFDVTQGREEVKWSALGTVGVAMENHEINLIYLYTRVAEDVATLAEDTRGKHFFWPGHDPDDIFSPGFFDTLAAPYRRNETLNYTERTTQTLQLNGTHTLPIPELEVINNFFTILPPEVDWTLAWSSATLDEPDKRQFASIWAPLPFPGRHSPHKEAASIFLGNFQRTWKDISEDSNQYFVNFKIPFEQWSGDEGYVKLGLFSDKVERKYNQESFSNFSVGPYISDAIFFDGEFEDLWTEVFPDQFHPITAADTDVDYRGEQEISAWYWMVDLPVTSFLSFIGGIRYENTELSIVNTPDMGNGLLGQVIWLPPPPAADFAQLTPSDIADVDFMQEDVLPAIGFVLKLFEDQITLRGSYTQTVARQTFKELTPILQQEYLGADIFIGNPALQMSSLENYDLRLDYTPYEGGLISVSYFYKDVKDPIEYVQRNTSSGAVTFPENYPEGTLSGFEFEVRQDLGHFFDALAGLSIGGNLTLIDSEVMLPANEADALEALGFPEPTRNMTNAPEYLYNLYLTYELETTGTQFGVFYSVRGDTLVAGAGQLGSNFVPDVYETEYGTLNMTLTQKIGRYIKLKFQAKNITNPEIQEVYRSDFLDDDVRKSSYTRGIDFSVGISAEFTF